MLIDSDFQINAKAHRIWRSRRTIYAARATNLAIICSVLNVPRITIIGLALLDYILFAGGILFVYRLSHGNALETDSFRYAYAS